MNRRRKYAGRQPNLEISRHIEKKMADRKSGERFLNISKPIGRKAYRETRDRQWEGKTGRQENWKIFEH